MCMCKGVGGKCGVVGMKALWVLFHLHDHPLLGCVS